MSSLLRPLGPLPPRVYWVRRLVVVAILAAVLVILFWAAGAVAGGGGGKAKTGTSTSSGSHASPSTSHRSSTPSPTNSTSISPSTTHTASHTTSPSKSTSPSVSTSTSSSAAAKPCTDKAIAVTVSTDAKSYPSDVQPRLAMSVRNAGSVACTRDVGQAALELRISTAAGVLVWSSDHCAPGGPHDVQTLHPNQVFRTAVVWSRTRSKQGCPTGQPKASPGTYVLTGRDVGVASSGARFDLL